MNYRIRVNAGLFLYFTVHDFLLSHQVLPSMLSSFSFCHSILTSCLCMCEFYFFTALSPSHAPNTEEAGFSFDTMVVHPQGVRYITIKCCISTDENVLL